MTELQQIKILSNEQINALRTSWNNYIRKLFIKEQCEICGCKDNLELHHLDKSFSVLVNESIDTLGINENNLTDKFDILKMYLLGVQVKGKYMTLCSKCHSKMHFYGTKRIDRMTKEELQDYIDEKIKKYLHVPLTKADKDKLVEELSVKNGRNDLLKWTNIKEMLLNSGYEIEEGSKKIKGKKTRISTITKKNKRISVIVKIKM